MGKNERFLDFCANCNKRKAHISLLHCNNFGQGRRKHLKIGRTRSKKGHMATPINGQNSKRFESIPNQVHTIFGWMGIKDYRPQGVSQKLLFHIENFKGGMEE